MLLRIVDKPNDKNDSDAVEITLTTKEQTHRFTAEYFPSPLSTNFRIDMDWYFTSYPASSLTSNSQGVASKTDRSVAEKIIKLGQQMGDQLLGEDYEFIKIKEIIEEVGFENISVEIESDRASFHQELWECLILAESKFVLSCVTKSFVRKYPSSNRTSESNQLTNFALSENAPINIIHVISHTNPSNGFNTALELLTFDNSINYEVWHDTHWSALEERLSCSEKPVHILHYDGPILINDDGDFIQLRQENKDEIALTPINQLANKLSTHNITLLSINATEYRHNSEKMSADHGLACISRTVLACGVSNIIGSSNYCDTWTASQSTIALLSQIAAGHTLSQAVVETRKKLQSITETDRFNAKPINFHSWSLLTHYSQRDVLFFKEPQQATEPNQSQRFQNARQRLLGFQSECLPPDAINCSDNNISTVWKEKDQCSIIGITGVDGSGKTQLTHQVGLHLILQNSVEFGFYFNYGASFYNAKDVLQMIAPVFEIDTDNIDAVKEQLDSKRCYFVFDNFLFDNSASDNLISPQNQSTQQDQNNASDDNSKDKNNSTDRWTEIHALIETLTQQGHVVLQTGNDDPNNSNNKITIKPLQLEEQRILTAEILRSHKIESKEEDADFQDLIHSLNGSPFMFHKAIPLLTTREVKPLLLSINATFNTENVTSTFCSWMFKKLPLSSQRLLLLITELPEVLLEMLQLACDQKDGFEPSEKLFTLLDPEEKKTIAFAEHLNKLDDAGFIKRYPYGRTIHQNNISRLQEYKEQDAFFKDNKEYLDLYLSQIICEGLQRLIPHAQDPQSQPIKSNLVHNRGRWVKYIEHLWFTQNYQAFMQVQNQLQSLLVQEKLGDEFSAWALVLLSKTESVTSIEPETLNKTLALLLLSQSAFGAKESEKEQTIIDLAALLQSWVGTLNDEKTEENFTLFSHAIRFLIGFYQISGQWQLCLDSNKIAVDVFSKKQAWNWVIHNLASCAKCCLALGDSEMALEYERQIFEDMPADGIPTPTRNQLMVETIIARITRGDTDNAQTLLDTCIGENQNKGLASTFSNLQAEIHLKNDNFAEATKIIFKLSLEAEELAQEPGAPDQFGPILEKLEKELGAEAYSKICLEIAKAYTENQINVNA